MRSVTWRRVVVGSASVAVTASLLVVPASVVSSSELVEAPAQEPVPSLPAPAAVQPVDEQGRADSAIDINEPDNVLLTRISIGPENPVAGARVILLDAEGNELARTESGANGQAVLIADEPLPRVVEVRALGGSAAILDSDQIRMRAWHNTRGFDIVHVNAYSTLEAACVELADRARCENVVRRYFDLPRGVDYSYAADFSVRALRGLDVNTLAWEIKNRDTTLWKHSIEMAREALAGEEFEYQREPGQAATAANAATGAVIRPRAAPLAALLLVGFAKALGTGAAARIGGLLMDKLLVAMGLMDPPGENNAATKEDIAELRRDLAEVKNSLVRVEGQLTAVRDDLERLLESAQQSAYVIQRTGFVQQATALERFARYFEYMLEYGDCAQSSPNADRCGNRTPPAAPREGVGLELCRNPGEADTRWSRGLFAQCAYVMNIVAEYTNRNEMAAGTNVLAGSANVPGLIQLSQVAFIAFRANNLLHAANQARMKSIGAYWMSLWSYETLIWWMAGEEPRLLPNQFEPNDVLEYTSQQRSRVEAAASDTSGEFFGRDIPAACGANFVVDGLTGTPHAIASRNPVRGDINHLRGFGLVVGDVCDGSRAWHGVDATRGDRLGRTANYLARETGVDSAYVGSSQHGSAAGRCFDIDLFRVLRNASGVLSACLRMSMTSTPAVTDLVCTGVAARGRWEFFLKTANVSAAQATYPVENCAADFRTPEAFTGSYCTSGEHWSRCRSWIPVRGPIWDTRGNYYGSPDTPTFLGSMPFGWMDVPALVAGRKLKPSMSQRFFATRSLQPGESYLPRL